MKVLSILQPWASLIILGHKKIETRSWIPKNPVIIKQLKEEGLLIHASAKKIRLQDGMYDLIDHMERIGFMNDYDKLPYGAVIGKVKFEAFIPSENIDSSADLYQQCTLVNSETTTIHWNCATISPKEEAFGDYSTGRFGWVLSDPHEYIVPMPVKGQLGLWNFDPDAFWKY